MDKYYWIWSWYQEEIFIGLDPLESKTITILVGSWMREDNMHPDWVLAKERLADQIVDLLNKGEEG